MCGPNLARWVSCSAFQKVQETYKTLLFTFASSFVKHIQVILLCKTFSIEMTTDLIQPASPRTWRAQKSEICVSKCITSAKIVNYVKKIVNINYAYNAKCLTQLFSVDTFDWFNLVLLWLSNQDSRPNYDIWAAGCFLIEMLEGKRPAECTQVSDPTPWVSDPTPSVISYMWVLTFPFLVQARLSDSKFSGTFPSCAGEDEQTILTMCFSRGCTAAKIIRCLNNIRNKRHGDPSI